jgi:hypothetical protein
MMMKLMNMLCMGDFQTDYATKMFRADTDGVAVWHKCCSKTSNLHVKNERKKKLANVHQVNKGERSTSMDIKNSRSVLYRLLTYKLVSLLLKLSSEQG